MMLKVYVKDISKAKMYIKLFETKRGTYYLWITHPELNIFDTLLINTGVFLISERESE